MLAMFDPYNEDAEDAGLGTVALVLVGWASDRGLLAGVGPQTIGRG